MKKNNIVRWLVIFTFLIVIILSFSIVIRFKNENKKKYEYYTFDNVKGISSKCESNEKVECKIKNKMIEVKQYSEIKKEEN